MTNMTLSIPEELMKKMKLFREVKWSEVARQAIEKRIDDLLVMEKIAQKSRLTQKDVGELSGLIKSSMAKRMNLK